MSNKHELKKLDEVREFWYEIYRAHLLRGDVYVQHTGTGDIIRTVVTNDTRVVVTSYGWDEDDVETRFIQVMDKGNTIFARAVSRLTLEDWLQEMKVEHEYDNARIVTDLINEIHRHGVARDVFMTLFRDSDQLKEQMSSEDAREVFVSVLLGEADLSKELFAEVCHEYSTSLPEVLGCELA